MKVTSVSIRIQESYQADAGQYRGKVEMSDDRSSATLDLSPKTLSRIFAVIQEDAKSEAMRMASATHRAVEDAVHTPLLLEESSIDSSL